MSLEAVPRRWMLPSAKTLIVVTTTIALSVPILALTAAIVAPIQRARGFQPETLGTYTFTTVFSGTLYLVLVAMLSVGVGGFLRSTIGSVITICSLLIVGPSLFNVILALTRGTHLVWIGNLGQLLPSSGGLFYTAQLPGLPDEQFSPDGAVTLTPIQGLAILTAWALIALVVWIINLYRRDAH
jgi:ABC-2 type transport system permease protein